MAQTASGTRTSSLLELYRHMVAAREMDAIEVEYTGRGEAFFHVSGAGHEASAVLNAFLSEDDWLHCHYRDKALLLARGMPPLTFFMSLFGKDGSHSRGRQMNAFMSDPALNVVSLSGPVGNSALQAVGVASVVKDRSGAPIVVCSLGDGTTQEGEVLEAIAHAVRDELPVLFLVQDNSFAISTRTEGRTFYSTPAGLADEFYGIRLRHVDGRDPVAAYEQLGDVVQQMREARGPAIVIFRVERLSSHTNADDQRVYRAADEIELARETGDPIAVLRRQLVDAGIAEDDLDRTRVEIVEELRQAARTARRSADPQPTMTAVKPLPRGLTDRDREYTGGTGGELTMLEAIREVLRTRMEQDERVQLFGEDLEDPKGDVFGVTRGLTTRFPGRVVNSPLAEATILGVTIGQALAGRRPVAFLQFADFLPIAYNQIFAELANIYWRTDGEWQVPVIVMVTCGGYRAGLGPFHAASMEAIAAHTPGVDVFMPSTAGDAAGLLNAAFDSGRPTIFFYPKSCLNDRTAATTEDVARQLVPIGTARVVRTGSDITLVGWGNTVGLCRRAAAALEKAGVQPEVIDLRSIVPWDAECVAESVRKTGRLLVTHEDSHTAGMGAEVVATVSELVSGPIVARRVTRPDTFVPFNFASQLEVLPSYRRILETAVSMLGGTVSWRLAESEHAGVRTIEAIGPSPSDESVTVITWHIAPGQPVMEGQLAVEMEADKASFEFRSPAAGTVVDLLCPEGDTIKVGEPLFSIASGDMDEETKPVTREEPGEPVITGIRLDRPPTAPDAPDPAPASVSAPATAPAPLASAGPRAETRRTSATALVAGLAGIACQVGSRTVTNEEIAAGCPTWSPIDIVKRTGIETRQWIGPGENALTLATEAARKALAEAKLGIDDVDLLLCATGTPLYATPAMAALIQHELAGGRDTGTAAYDISAACSGYVYGLQIAYDYLHSSPEARVLLVTTETLSPRTNTADPDTAPIFGDAATASVIVGAANASAAVAEIFRPATGAQGESGEALMVPAGEQGTIAMDGIKVYQLAVRSMIDMLQAACSQAGVGVEQLGLIVPHQANQRIINAVRQKLRLPVEQVYSNIRNLGNTSSSTIPLCLAQLLGERKGEYIGLTAFGGGFTYAGGVLRVLGETGRRV